MKYLIIALLLLQGCRNNLPYTGNAGKGSQEKICNDDEGYSTRAIRCLMTFITGGDSGGTWEAPGHPVTSNIEELLVGSNPCIEWTTQPCGIYTLLYIVGDECCRDTATVNLNKCCLTGVSVCNF